MQIETNFIPTMSIDEFADSHGLVMVVSERREPSQPNTRFYAHFKGAEVMEPNTLVAVCGDGSTPDEAIAAYARVLSLKRIALGAFTDQRTEIDVPRLTGGEAR